MSSTQPQQTGAPGQVSHSRVGTDASDVSSPISPQSSLGRGSSLRRKSGQQPGEEKPSDLLADRYTSWKHIIKDLIQYFNGIVDLENSKAKDYQKISSKLTVPFKDANQFLGSGGVQDVFFTLRDKTKTMADAHAEAAKHIDSTVVQGLETLRSNLKKQVKTIDDDTGKLDTSVRKEREASTKQISELARHITLMKSTPLQVKKDQDPFFTNLAVRRQLGKQIAEENQLQKSLVSRQEQCKAFEASVVSQLQNILNQFDEQTARSNDVHKNATASIASHVRQLKTDTEWNDFMARNPTLVDPNAPLRTMENIDYPGRDEAAHQPLKDGILLRKGKILKSYKEAYYVLTPAGYFHEHKSTDLTKDYNADTSLFLPDCSLSQPSLPTDKSPKFTISGKQQGLMHREQDFTFKAKSHEEMMEWYDAIKKFTKEALSSTTTDHSGPVVGAVRTQGLPDDTDEEVTPDSAHHNKAAEAALGAGAVGAGGAALAHHEHAAGQQGQLGQTAAPGQLGQTTAAPGQPAQTTAAPGQTLGSGPPSSASPTAAGAAPGIQPAGHQSIAGPAAAGAAGVAGVSAIDHAHQQQGQVPQQQGLAQAQPQQGLPQGQPQQTLDTAPGAAQSAPTRDVGVVGAPTGAPSGIPLNQGQSDLSRNTSLANSEVMIGGVPYKPDPEFLQQQQQQVGGAIPQGHPHPEAHTSTHPSLFPTQGSVQNPGQAKPLESEAQSWDHPSLQPALAATHGNIPEANLSGESAFKEQL